MVTSGAVASEPLAVFSKNLRSAIGQAKLIGEYREFFEIFGITPAQILVVDTDFISVFRSVALRTIEEAIRYNTPVRMIVPIINANDVVSNNELEALSACADNDRLSQLICEQLGDVDIMIIGMDEEGLRGKDGKIIHRISPRAQLHPSIDNLGLLLSFVNGCSEKDHGNEGMRTKISVAYRLAESGVKVVLAPGREKDLILRAVAGEENFGTTFLPA